MSIEKALVYDGSRTNQAISGKLLGDLGIAADTAINDQQAWGFIKKHQNPYDLVLVSRSALGQGLNAFVARIRLLKNYASVPLILIIGDKTDEIEIESLYNSGFTQIFSRKEFDLLEDYIKQAQGRTTFEKANHNKVVIIEDDLSQQLTIQAILEDKDCECFCFYSAEEALAQAESIQPHVITCDFFLKGKMTAMDLVLQTRHEGHPWHNVPIMVMTGLDDTARKYELVRSGANDYIAKPIDGLDLSVRVENLIRYKHLLDKVEQQKEEMKYLAMHDQLTGLYNRHFVAEQVAIGITEAQRHNHDYALIILDVDFFKKVNDEHGHDVGDEVLKGVASFLQSQARSNDVVARLGGEEFLMLMNHCNLSAAAHKANGMREGLEALMPAGLKVTASFGVSQLSSETDNFDKLFKSADEAVYRAKTLGRNRVEIAVNQKA